MSTITHRLTAASGVPAAPRESAHAAWTWAARRFKAFGASLTRRRAIHDLSRLDDRMLADMGLTRSDLQAASRWSLWGDPTDRLAGVAEERRAAGR
jgi:uncharacterized protein YjiS (DUF1127 family)